MAANAPQDGDMPFIDEFIMVGENVPDKKSDDSPKQNTPPVLRDEAKKELQTVHEKRRSYLGTERSFFSAEKISAEKFSIFNAPRTNSLEDWKTVILSHLERVNEAYRVPEQLDEKDISALRLEYQLYRQDELQRKLVLENTLYELKLKELVQMIQNAQSPGELLQILQDETVRARSYQKVIGNPEQGQRVATALYGRYGAFVLREMPKMYADYQAHCDAASTMNTVNSRRSLK